MPHFHTDKNEIYTVIRLQQTRKVSFKHKNTNMTDPRALYELLNPEVKKNLDESGVKLSTRDLEALTKVKVKDLAKLYDAQAKALVEKTPKSEVFKNWVKVVRQTYEDTLQEAEDKKVDEQNASSPTKSVSGTNVGSKLAAFQGISDQQKQKELDLQKQKRDLERGKVNSQMQREQNQEKKRTEEEEAKKKEVEAKEREERRKSMQERIAKFQA
jgi:hypothetical protein